MNEGHRRERYSRVRRARQDAVAYRLRVASSAAMHNGPLVRESVPADNVAGDIARRRREGMLRRRVRQRRRRSVGNFTLRAGVPVVDGVDRNRARRRRISQLRWTMVHVALQARTTLPAIHVQEIVRQAAHHQAAPRGNSAWAVSMRSLARESDGCQCECLTADAMPTPLARRGRRRRRRRARHDGLHIRDIGLEGNDASVPERWDLQDDREADVAGTQVRRHDRAGNVKRTHDTGGILDDRVSLALSRRRYGARLNVA